MQKCSVSKLVFSSSATVYRDQQYLPIDEVHQVAPINPYVQTKLHIRQTLQNLCKADKNLSVANLRYLNPVGANFSGLIGENPRDTPNNLMPCISQVAVGKQRMLSIYGDDYTTQDGTGDRDYIHVMDLAQGHLSASSFLKKTMVCQLSI